MKILAIDPGAGGGLAWDCINTETATMKMPDTMGDIADTIRTIVTSNRIDTVCIENVGGYMPGNSGPAAVKFAKHIGHLEAICYMLTVRVVKVAPASWMKVLGTFPKGSDSKSKAARKNAIKGVIQTRFPALSVTLKTSDALGILEWARRQR